MWSGTGRGDGKGRVDGGGGAALVAAGDWNFRKVRITAPQKGTRVTVLGTMFTSMQLLLMHV